MGGHPQHVCPRVGGRGRHWALRCHGVAVRARRRVRAMPDLQQRALALRSAPRSLRSRLPVHVRRPYARSKSWGKPLNPACSTPPYVRLGASRTEQKGRYAGVFQSRLPDSNRRPPPHHEREEGSIHAGFRVMVRVCVSRASPLSVAFCVAVRPQCDLDSEGGLPRTTAAAVIKAAADCVPTSTAPIRPSATRGRRRRGSTRARLRRPGLPPTSRAGASRRATGCRARRSR